MKSAAPTDEPPSPLPNLAPQTRSWAETAAVFAAAVLVLAVATVVGNSAAQISQRWLGADAAQARPAGEIADLATIVLATFLAGFQVTCAALACGLAGLFRGGRVALLALRMPTGIWRACARHAVILIGAAGLYGAAILLLDRNALIGDLALLADVLKTEYWWLIAVAVVFGAPLAEELVFRGLLYGGLRNSPVGPAAAAIVTTVIWAALHVQYSIYGVVAIAAIGLYLAYVREATGSLLAPIVCHAAYNATVLAIIMLVPAHYMQLG